MESAPEVSFHIADTFVDGHEPQSPGGVVQQAAPQMSAQIDHPTKSAAISLCIHCIDAACEEVECGAGLHLRKTHIEYIDTL
jgi:hypothetical protein